ncbi:MAG: hypothetical protein VW600_17735, partial [Ferrovibrio sp.]
MGSLPILPAFRPPVTRVENVPFRQNNNRVGFPMTVSMLRRFAAPALLLSSLAAFPALAAEEKPLDAANTAWILTATALVLFMTMPGLALFYAGLVRARNALSVV